MSTDEYLIGSGVPIKSNAINYTSDDDDPRGENAVMGLLSNSQFIKRLTLSLICPGFTCLSVILQLYLQ